MNYKLTLSYDGGRYKGWQKQGNADNTIQGKIERVLERITGESVEVSGCGRTDAGVHAKMQVCSFRSDTDLSCEKMLALLRQYLPEDIAALDLEKAEPRFHARLSCEEKTYLYKIRAAAVPDVFDRKYCYFVGGELDTEKMRRAARYFSGTHDFAAFCSLKNPKKSTVRTIYDISVRENGGLITVMLRGNGFLYNMIRIIVGTLVETGRGERDPETILEIIESKNRENAGFTAPAHGLFLWDIKY